MSALSSALHICYEAEESCQSLVFIWTESEWLLGRPKLLNKCMVTGVTNIRDMAAYQDGSMSG